MSDLVQGALPLLAAHLELVIAAMLIAVAISMPVAILVAGRPRLAAPVVATAGVLQTIPGLALLALMVAVLAGLGLRSFGFAPALIALVLYAILPILRNAVTGLRGVDPAVVEAALGQGMTSGQLLRLVQLPLAAPVIAAGIRTATIWTVGAATLATPVGQSCLGNYIFAGLQTRNWPMLIVGVVAAAALAIVLDLLLGAIESSFAHRRRPWPALALLTALCLLIVLALPHLGGTDASVPLAREQHATAKVTNVRIGAKTFTEQYILAEVIRQRLAASGIASEIVPSLGSTIAFDALLHGEIDAYVDYSGTLYSNQMHHRSRPARWKVQIEVEAWLADQDIRSLGPLGFENAYTLAMKRTTANRLHLTQLTDLAQVAPRFSIGGDYEWFSRGEWAAVRTAYGLHFARTATFDPALLYDAVARDEVDVISAFSSDGRLAADDLVTLADPRGALPPYDAMILLGARVSDDPTVECALAPLRGAITVDLMRRANLMVDRATDKSTPAEAAAWLLREAHVPPGC